ncbi:predicted protein [Lichtheimia corymbifera JMRC:FSU:9682]|uniref:Uncharacterized protein n=1 Tax=Lichtheimia corymbifera JMRC:FSU:9682 TaxID=1263082 RepID=A0A068SGP3_9FUNG|nr:predicted protein [Lichtheimia corymbifera JMRC:FSU:9682]
MTVTFTRNSRQTAIPLPTVRANLTTFLDIVTQDKVQRVLLAIFNRCHEYLSLLSTLDTANDPNAFNPMAFMAFTLAELGFINFNNDSLDY